MTEEAAPGTGGEWRPDAPLPPITRIELPTPFPVGPVNCYIVDEDPLTLVDCGPLTEDAWAELQAGLGRQGRRVQDIRRLIITHGHVDHFGLAARIVELSGAEVWAYRSLERWLGDYEAEWQRRTAYLTLLLTEMGVPAGEMVAINRVVKGVGRFAQAVPVARLLDAGDVLSLA